MDQDIFIHQVSVELSAALKKAAAKEAAAKKGLTLERAKGLIALGEEKAAAVGVPMVITVVDDGGNVKAQHRMDGSLLASIAISYEKAYTAVALQSTTEEAAASILPGQPLYVLSDTHPGKFCLFGGGIPIWSKSSGLCLGAVGVSGGTVEQDVAVARYMISNKSF